MHTTRTAANEAKTGRARSAGVQVLVPVITAPVIAAVLVFLMVSSFHAPTPHGVPVGISAPAKVVTTIETGLNQTAPRAFSPVRFADARAVEHAVAEGDVIGGLAIAKKRAWIVTAGAQGRAASQAIETAFGTVTRTAGLRTRTIDTTPLPSTNSLGLSTLMIVIGITVAGVVFTAATLGGGPIALRWLFARAAAFAVLAGLAGAFSADSLVGAVGHFAEVAGIAALLGLAVATVLLAVGRGLGRHGLGLGAPLWAVLLIATSGGGVGYRFEPGFQRTVSQWLPGGAALEALRDVVYFGGTHVLGRIAVLGTWIALALAILVALAALSTRRAPVAEVA